MIDHRGIYIEQFVKIDTQLNIEATVEDILQVMSLRREVYLRLIYHAPSA